MALCDRFLKDNHKIFMNLEHFAEEHTWDGIPFTCVPDDTEALKRKNNNVNDLSWDADMVEKIIYVPEDSLPARAQPNEEIIFDGVIMRVLDVIDAKGMKEISLTTRWAKGVMME
ncbi:MAG: hypothetical protein IJ188_06415 [Clostridia bacterium]|nr:hypothetical protein [Clostridia bacterium]